MIYDHEEVVESPTQFSPKVVLIDCQCMTFDRMKVFESHTPSFAVVVVFAMGDC